MPTLKVKQNNTWLSVGFLGNNAEDSTNKVSSWQQSPDDTHYPTEKLVKDSLDDKISEPANDGTNGQVLTTNGNGGRSWTTIENNQDISGKADVTETGYSLSVNGTSVSLKNKAGTVLSTITTQDTNTTYATATNSTDGLMSSTDKIKLDEIETHALLSLKEGGKTTLPITQYWNSVTYGDGKFVAIANSTYAAYSTDGINWIQSSFPSSGVWKSVTYGNGKFVAIASSSNKAMYSTDGITWTETTLPNSENWTSVAYGGGKFLAVASNYRLAAYSTDGINWTSTTLSDSANWKSVTYGDGKFVVVDFNNQVTYSDDGINWSDANIGSVVKNWNSVTYGNGKFVVVGSRNNASAYSTNGSSWVSSYISSLSWQSVTYGDGKFVAVAYNSNKAAYSTNGINWTLATLPVNALWQSVTYGDGKFVAVAYNSNIAACSTDGITWNSILYSNGSNKKTSIQDALDINSKISEPSSEGENGQVLTTDGNGGRTWTTIESSSYTLPVAGSDIGGVKSGTDITVDASGNVSVNDDSHNHIIGNIDGLQAALDERATSSHTHSYIAISQKGAASGVAELDENGKVPSSQLPSYVDDVLEYTSQSSFPTTGETGKIYVDATTNLTYRWSGSDYVEISPSLALGETSSTAYRGDRGATAYTHSQNTGNPHGTTKSDIGLGNVDNKSSETIRSEITKANVTTALGTGSGTTKYLREDGTWEVPPGVTDVSDKQKNIYQQDNEPLNPVEGDLWIDTDDDSGDAGLELNNKEDISNKVTSISSDSTDTQYPSAKCVYDVTTTLGNNIHTHANKSTLDDITASASEINTLDGITASTEELNYCDGVTSNIQTQLNAKADKRIVKTAMDATATVNTDYFLGTQTSVSFALPTCDTEGQYITVVFYSGTIAATLSISGNTVGTIPIPSTNQRIELNILWDGAYWAIVSNVMEAA